MVSRQQVRRTGARRAPLPAGNDRAGRRVGSRRDPVVLRSKLHPPVAPPGAVVRPALLEQLEDDPAIRLVLVVAPAGWGKTTLLRDWREAGRAGRTGWLSLDASDNDPVRFWGHVIAALRTVLPGLALTDAALRAPGTSVADSVLPLLINEVAELPTPVALVLDDYHLVADKEIVHAMGFLLEHLPPTLRMVIASRADAALPTARLRARGELVEVRADDLRFTKAEAGVLLNDAMGLGLPGADVAALQRRTEGWPAGLYLAGLSLRGSLDPSGFVTAFAGDDRQIVDYLASEVLEGLPAQLRSFLLRTSVLGRLSGPLCDAVTEQGGSQRVLQEIERSNLFLVPLDTTRRWYRYHHLFAALLRSELARTEPGLVDLLHRRAAAWHREFGTVAEAVDHAISAGDVTDARELIAAQWNVYFNEGLVSTVDAWLDRLPGDVVVEDARLCLIRAWVSRHLGRLEQVEPWLETALAVPAQGPLRDDIASIESAACLLRAGYRYMVGDLSGGERAARRAVDLEASGTPNWHAASLATLGVILCWQGRLDEARVILDLVLPRHRPPANNLGALWAAGSLALASVRAGDVAAAERYLRLATRLTGEHHLAEYWISAAAKLASAELLETRGELAQADAEAGRGLELARRGRARLETAYALNCLARIASATGHADEAGEHQRAARSTIAGCTDPGIASAPARSTGRPGLIGPHQRPGPPLSDRERQVLRLLGGRLSLREIAAELRVSPNTIKTQTRSIYRKLGVSTREQAVAAARPPSS
jgi:LuxR family transcriptional regulator, maltose regulon positive regulatory protein